jgi:hypothetical protein
MRAYLTPVADKAGSGNFLAGLTAAGVPDSVLWAPARYIANGGGNGATVADIITDKLWLPTEREMFGSRTYSNSIYETAANQARLEYYGENSKRIKHKSGSSRQWYWEASPEAADASSFCAVDYAGTTANGDAGIVGGCAPAFCVK